MRWIYLAIVVVFVAALIIFMFQNTQSVDVSFLALGATLPLAMLVFVVYVLGALSGGSLYALLRRSVAGSRARLKAASGHARHGPASRRTSGSSWRSGPSLARTGADSHSGRGLRRLPHRPARRRRRVAQPQAADRAGA